MTVSPYYTQELNTCIASLLEQLTKIAQSDRLQKRQYEERYVHANDESGNFMREMGTRGLKFTGLALVILASQFAVPTVARAFNRPLTDAMTKGCQELLSFAANQGCTGITNMLNGDTQSQQKRVEAVAQLALTEINGMQNKQSDANKQELTRILDTVSQSILSVARGGG